MPLTSAQQVQLAGEIDRQWDRPRLILFAGSLGINLQNSAAGTVKEQAYELIQEMNRPGSPRDRELLEALRQANNAALRRVAEEFLKPGYFPPDDAHRALILGRTAFVARDLLRDALRDFTATDEYTTHVLVVRGNTPGGKSYTWEFLRHLATNVAAVQPQRLSLKGTNYTPRQFLSQALVLLGLEDGRVLPELTDEPQLARTSPLLNAFKGRLGDLKKPYWLVIDDLNDPAVTPAVRETAYAMAFVVEEVKPANLWLALLGYNPEIVDPELRFIAIDDAEFPSRDSVVTCFERVAQAGGAALTIERAKEITDLMFSQFPTLNKEAMIRLTMRFEQMSAKLKAGLVP